MSTIIKNLIARFVREDEGQDLIEYALLAAFISLVCLLMIINTGISLNTLYSSINQAVSNAAASGS